MIASVDDLRQRGILLVAIGGWIATCFLAVMAVTYGKNAVTAACVCAVLSMLPTWAAIMTRSDVLARILTGIVAAMLPVVVRFGMHDSLWQIDLHLYFFIALAALTLLLDIRPILAACSIMVLNHIIGSVGIAGYVAGTGTDMIRLIFHVIAVGLIGAVLCWISRSLATLLRRIEIDRLRSHAQSKELQATTDRLEEAINTLHHEQEEAEKVRNALQEERKAAYADIATQFEQSVIAVTASVASTADLLQTSARNLKLLAYKAGKEARDVAGDADTASRAASTVAAGVAELSLSIAEVAVHAGQQSELTGLATDRSGGGGQAIGSLTQHSRTIGQATQAISRIAEKTNLLALNATIEAASAGEAGRGFSIVANEVKLLADQAAQAASEIDSFLKGVKTGTHEAERSFQAIDAAISELGQAAQSILHDVESQRQSADTIESFARGAAGDADDMAQRTHALAERARAASLLSTELDHAARALAENVHNLEASTRSFTAKLKAA